MKRLIVTKQGKESTNITLNRFVFLSSATLILLFTALCHFFPSEITTYLATLQNQLAQYFGWYYMLVVAAYLFFVIFLAISPYGKIILGAENSQPDFSYAAWAGMLFSSGIGVSLLYFGASEALTHYLFPPDMPGGVLQAEQSAVVYTMLHWGIHGWAIYALIAIAIGYYSYRLQHPLALRSALYPLIGRRTDGLAGDLIDCFGIIVTVFGLVSNLGIGTLQISAGIEKLFGLTHLSGHYLTLLMFVMITTATLVAISGIEVGIRRLSNINIVLFAALFFFVLFVGPTASLLNKLVQNLGDYIAVLPKKTFDVYAYHTERSWLGKWTLFYWAWWIAWGPFVGLFIARISRGRTIREVVTGVLLIPLGFTLAWLSVLGNSTLELFVKHDIHSIVDSALHQPAMAIYQLFSYYPYSQLIIGIATIVGFILFLTPADSGLIMLANLSIYQRNTGKDAPNWLRIFWALIIFGVTAGLMYANNIIAIQTMIVLASLPFSIIMLLYMFCLMKSLRAEKENDQ